MQCYRRLHKHSLLCYVGLLLGNTHKNNDRRSGELFEQRHPNWAPEVEWEEHK